ncbi:YceH family protein [Dongshaea marina]|uniref:YceH family protein n=1 Tax=Dongshaea marina TaxID=2047966 RepID=UPI000D3E8EC8|nr:DUF480 domain-containing protein [Dongshaea marina]
MKLTLHEARVIGSLLEKEITTPEQYPLSLNALTLACNQKSSRDPVLSLSESETQNALDSLASKRLISEQSGFGSRVVKYKHRFCNTEFSELKLNGAELAVICLLLLRGPQTPGELRSRSNRLHGFENVAEVESTLRALSQRETPLVKQLAREPGKREARFTELFSEELSELATDEGRVSTDEITELSALSERVGQLELEVATLKASLAKLTGES